MRHEDTDVVVRVYGWHIPSFCEAFWQTKRQLRPNCGCCSRPTQSSYTNLTSFLHRSATAGETSGQTPLGRSTGKSGLYAVLSFLERCMTEFRVLGRHFTGLRFLYVYVDYI